MAKENVAKFYEKLGEDTALVEKLSALDKAFSPGGRLRGLLRSRAA